MYLTFGSWIRELLWHGGEEGGIWYESLTCLTEFPCIIYSACAGKTVKLVSTSGSILAGRGITWLHLYEK